MKPRQYTQSEIRTFRTFLVLILAIGVFAFIGGLANLHKWPTQDHSQASAEEDPSSVGSQVGVSNDDIPKKVGSQANLPLTLFAFSAVFLLLAGAGILAVRKVLANGLRDVEFDPVIEAAEQASERDAASPRP